jgi:hypothetical protein
MERKKINAKFLLDLDPYPNFKGKSQKKKKKKQSNSRNLFDPYPHQLNSSQTIMYNFDHSESTKGPPGPY